MKKCGNCAAVRKLLGAFLDKELSPEESGIVRRHLERCATCAQEFDALRDADYVGKTSVFPDPGDKFWELQRREISAKIGRMHAVPPGNMARSDVWSAKIFGSFGWKTALGLSAAAALILVTTKEFYRDEAVVPEIPPAVESVLDTDAAEGGNNPVEGQTARGGRQIPGNAPAPEKPSKKGVLQGNDAPVGIVTPPAAVKAHDEKPDVRRQESPGTPAPGVSPDASEAGKQKIAITPETLLPPTASHLNNARTAPAGDNLTVPSSRLSFTVSKNDHPSGDAFEAYLAIQQEIEAEDNLVERKNRWRAYLDGISDNSVRDLVVNDLYEAYTRIVTPESPPELKSEFLDFVIRHEKTLTSILGESLYRKRLDTLKRMM